MNNLEVREAIKAAGLKQWQVAEGYGLHEGNFSRLFRKELSETEKQKIMEVIEKVKEGVR